MWMQTNIAKWRWLPRLEIYQGAIFEYEKVYKPSVRKFSWGKWIWAWEIALYPFDTMPEGQETIVNDIPCHVKHWEEKHLDARRRRV